MAVITAEAVFGFSFSFSSSLRLPRRKTLHLTKTYIFSAQVQANVFLMRTMCHFKLLIASSKMCTYAARMRASVDTR